MAVLPQLPALKGELFSLDCAEDAFQNCTGAGAFPGKRQAVNGLSSS